MKRGGRLVYSTGPDASRDARQDATGPPAEPSESLPPAKQRVRVRRERGGRRGKTVTVVGPLILLRDDAVRLHGRLKKRCASGGAVKHARTRDDRPCFELEVQGDHVEAVLAELAELGYEARRAGG